MLIWITAPSAAIGILALLILLSTAPSKGYPITTLSDETTTFTSTEGKSLKIRDLPFATFIANPCSPGTSRSTDRNRSKAQRHSFSITFFQYMKNYGTLYKQDALKGINSSTIEDCSSLNLPNLPNSPTLQELQEMNEEGALKRMYSSLLKHSAHAYFVDHQYLTLGETCPEADRERNLAREAVILARKQKHMACMTQMTLEELGYTPDDTNAILDERLTNLQMCSRRALRDCQIMLSIVHLFDVISNYSSSTLESPQTN